MNEPTVQVPVSLLRRWVDEFDHRIPEQFADELHGLLSQPTPTIEPCLECGGDRSRGMHTLSCSIGQAELTEPSCTCAPGSPDYDGPLIDCPVHGLPSRIEDMAPGTTFVHLHGLWEVIDQHHVLLRNGPGAGITYRSLTDFDPSTIRDVTLPKGDNTPTA